MRSEYERLVDLGLLDDAPVELLEGMLVEMSPEGPRHRWVIDLLADHLTHALPRQWLVAAGHPWIAGDVSLPEPDLAIVPRARYERRHPDEALLLVEVAHSSLRKDLTAKATLYAAAGAPTYWVIDLTRDVVHVHTDPTPEGYRSVVEQPFDDPLDVAGVRVVLSELLA